MKAQRRLCVHARPPSPQFPRGLSCIAFRSRFTGGLANSTSCGSLFPRDTRDAQNRLSGPPHTHTGQRSAGGAAQRQEPGQTLFHTIPADARTDCSIRSRLRASSVLPVPGETAPPSGGRGEGRLPGGVPVCGGGIHRPASVSTLPNLTFAPARPSRQVPVTVTVGHVPVATAALPSPRHAEDASRAAPAWTTGPFPGVPVSPVNLTPKQAQASRSASLRPVPSAAAPAHPTEGGWAPWGARRPLPLQLRHLLSGTDTGPCLPGTDRPLPLREATPAGSLRSHRRGLAGRDAA